MHSITRRFEWDAAHRVMGHEGKCRNLHGHRYVAEVTVVADDGQLDELARVIDFSKLKEVLGGWIDENWDHNAIFRNEDPLIEAIDRATDAVKLVYVMESNPTAEAMAEHLFERAANLLDVYCMRPTRVVLHETPNCSATYEP